MTPTHIYVQRLLVPDHNLAYWTVSLAVQLDRTDSFIDLPHVLTTLDAHWQHRAAMQCASRWSREFNLPIWGKKEDK
jgi:hypothetical protein